MVKEVRVALILFVGSSNVTYDRLLVGAQLEKKWWKYLNVIKLLHLNHLNFAQLDRSYTACVLFEDPLPGYPSVPTKSYS